MQVDITSLLRICRSTSYTRARFWGALIGLEIALFLAAYVTLWGR